MYNPLFRIFLQISTLPARLKGMKIAVNSYLSPGYDFWGATLNNTYIKDEVYIGKNAWINTIENGKIEIDSGTHVGRNCVIHSKKSVKIGKKCLFSYNVSIIDHDHVFSKGISPLETGTTTGTEIKIGDKCFIGAHSFVLKGVILGDGCIVGANSVVTKSFPPFSMIAGSPAKLINR